MEIIVCVLFIAFVVVGVFLLVDAANNKKSEAALNKRDRKQRRSTDILPNGSREYFDIRVIEDLTKL